MKNKIVIIGTGNVGVSYAYSLLCSNLNIHEIILIDINTQKAEGEALDLLNCTPLVAGSTKIRFGTYGDCNDASIVCITAGVSQRANIKSRMEDLFKATNIFKDIDYSNFYTCSSTERLDLITKLADYVFSFEEKERNDFLDNAAALKKAEALCRSIISREESAETALYEAVKVIITKMQSHQKLSLREINHRINKILEGSIQSEGIMNIFDGKEDSKELYLFDKKYLESIANMKYKNIALEVLNKLLNDKIKAHLKVNIIQSNMFSDRMKKIMEKYHNKAIDNIEVIDELLNMANDLDNIEKEAKSLGLTNEEKAIYDAICSPMNNDYNKEEIKTMAKELSLIVQNNAEEIDWQYKESTKAKMKMDIKRFLKLHKYPKEKENEALDNILKQAENYASLKYS